MESLSTEILHSILYEVWLWHRQDILHATLVCRAWYEIAQSILVRDIDNLVLAPLAKNRNEFIFRRIESDMRFQRRLRRICVVDVHSSGQIPVNRTGIGWEFNFRGRGQNEYGYLEGESADTWSQILRLANVIPKLSLATFSWRAKPNIPAPIIDALEKMKDCRVHIETRADDPEEFYNCRFSFESILSRKGLMGLNSVTHNLRVLEVIIPAPEVVPSGEDMLTLLGRLIHKSSLKNLGIHAAGRIYPWSKYEENAFGTIRDFGWLFNDTDSAQKKLNLQALRLTNFCLCRSGEKSIRSMHDLVSWKALRRAHFTCPIFLQIAAEQDVQLRSLSLHLDNLDDGVRSCVEVPDFSRLRVFLASQENLRTLEIYNGSQIFAALDTDKDISFFESLGNSLVSLAVHHNESRNMSPNKVLRPLLSRTELQQMGKNFRHLRRLAIDVSSEDSMMFQYLTTISKSFPSLYELELNLEIEKQWQIATRTPVSKDFCYQIWERYRIDSPSRVPSRITVSVGAMSASERLEETDSWWAVRHRRYVIEAQPAVKSLPIDGQQSPIIKMIELEEFNKRLCLDQNARYKGLCEKSLHSELESIMDNGVVWRPPQVQPYVMTMPR